MLAVLASQISYSVFENMDCLLLQCMHSCLVFILPLSRIHYTRPVEWDDNLTQQATDIQTSSCVCRGCGEQPPQASLHTTMD